MGEKFLYLDAAQAALKIKSGGVVAIPTETVYGLGASALDPTAVARVFGIKERPLHHPLIVHISDLDWLLRLAAEVPETALRLAHAAWPGPVTVVLRKTELLPEIVTAGLPSVAIRMPAHPLALEILKRAQVPIAAPSANPFGTLSPTTALDVEQSLGSRIDGIVDGGPADIGVESTIVSFLEKTPRILRPGGLSRERLETILGPVTTADPNTAPIAPGMLPKHYAPKTRVVFLDSSRQLSEELARDAAVLCFQEAPAGFSFKSVEVLSQTGDFHEAAARLYSALRQLDSQKPSRILAFAVPEKELGVAINDRLRRAAS